MCFLFSRAFRQEYKVDYNYRDFPLISFFFFFFFLIIFNIVCFSSLPLLGIRIVSGGVRGGGRGRGESPETLIDGRTDLMKN